MNLISTSSPHVRSDESTRMIMLDVVIALMPALIWAVYIFGINALLITVVSVLSAVLSEAAVELISKKPLTIGDFSAVVTGILVAFNVSPAVPIWMPAIGSAFAIIVVKQFFGGIGQNFMNPALGARAFMMASWPVAMTTWVTAGTASAISGATPLAILKGTATGELPSIWNMFIGNIGGCIGEVSAAALILGGLYLLWKGVITWRIPVVYIATTLVLTLIFGKNPMEYVFAGGLMLGSIFMATDYSSSPITNKGQIIYAVGCGVLTAVIRVFGGYPEGVSYSILLMNVAAPLIDKLTRPRIYGEVAKKNV